MMGNLVNWSKKHIDYIPSIFFIFIAIMLLVVTIMLMTIEPLAIFFVPVNTGLLLFIAYWFLPCEEEGWQNDPEWYI
jgi:hypothetical protein